MKKLLKVFQEIEELLEKSRKASNIYEKLMYYRMVDKLRVKHKIKV